MASILGNRLSVFICGASIEQKKQNKGSAFKICV